MMRVALAVLLLEEALGAARRWRQPRAPLIDHQRDLLLRIVLIHDRAVRAEQIVHAQRVFSMVAYSLSPKPVALNAGGHFTTV